MTCLRFSTSSTQEVPEDHRTARPSRFGCGMRAVADIPQMCLVDT
jgi:hypothetical protein